MDEGLLTHGWFRAIARNTLLLGCVSACVTDPDVSTDTTVMLDAGSEDDVVSTDAVPDTAPPLLSCEDSALVFPRCVESPTGIWRIRQWCVDAANYDPLDGTCPSVIASGTGRASGIVQFGSDGEFIIRIEEGQSDVQFQFGLECYGGSATPCQGRNFAAVCELAGSDGSICACERSQQYNEEMVFGTWVRTGTFIELRPDAAASEVATFCLSQEGRQAEFRVPQISGLLPARMLLERMN